MLTNVKNLKMDVNDIIFSIFLSSALVRAIWLEDYFLNTDLSQMQITKKNKKEKKRERETWKDVKHKKTRYKWKC